MKLTMKLLALFFGVLMLANVANAESPREQLRQMVGQLQQNPGDDALRVKIIKLAQTDKPALAVPEEAERFEGRAQFAFKNAKSSADYLDAAREYEKAIAVAPWVAGYYADLCTIYEKAEKYAEAKKSCEFFLASSPSAQDASDVRKRIAGLEFAMEKVTTQKNRADEFLRRLDGARFVRRLHQEFRNNRGEPNGWADRMYIYEVRGNKIVFGSMITATDKPDRNMPIGKMDSQGEYLIKGREFVIPRDDQLCNDIQQRCLDEVQGISEDGNKITEHRSYPGYTMKEQIYLREK